MRNGIYCTGRKTQQRILYEKLTQKGFKVGKIEFPNYESTSSDVVKMYLNGEFGKDPNSVNAYAASILFAVDRFATVKNTAKDVFENNDIVIADRYTTSNMVHQASKISDLEEKSSFLDWLYDMEYKKLTLPEPDITIFLDMPVEYAKKLMANRANKIDNTMQKDIHESNDQYLYDAYNNACFVAQKYNWKRIYCVNNGKVRTIPEIADEIFDEVMKIL